MGKGLGIAILAAKEASKGSKHSDKEELELEDDDDSYDSDEEGEELFSDYLEAIESGDKAEGYAAFKALMAHCSKE